ncbi:MAG TPA: 4,5-DOPA dioxygenase extradiol [Spirochaetia bacterium]|nr:4,5-DOPA dioxygenase extradiol [Spirochaetia bacterium]
MPALFIGHGSPMNAMMKNAFTRALENLGKALPRPEAIMVISAHWLTKGTFVTCSENPRQIYDFYGFPDELYQVAYRPPGAPVRAARTTHVLQSDRIRCDDRWGLDHASWAVLKHMYPEADVPVFEMSLDLSHSEQDHYDLGGKLSYLRDEGVLIIGSGNIVHNLGLVEWDAEAEPCDWASAFDQFVSNRLLDRDHDALVNYRRMGAPAALAVPTNDHYLPMLYIASLHGIDEPLNFIFHAVQHGSISMRCFQIG